MKKLLTTLFIPLTILYFTGSILLIATVSYAETITLTSGKFIEGEIIERTDELIKVDTGVGVITTYYLDEIDEVGVKNSQAQPIIQKGDSFALEIKGDEIRKEFYPNGNVQYERSFKDGQKHGLTKMFSEDGKLWQDVVYVDGMKQGIWREYYPSGNLKETRIYKNDTVNGIAKRYFENGKPERERMWVNNFPDSNKGIKTWDYYDNGNLKSEYFFKYREGYRKDYYENGQLSLEFLIKGGQLIDCKNYDEEGNFVSAECPEK